MLYSDNGANNCELEERVQLVSQRVGRCLERMGPATQASINIDIEVCDRCGGLVKVIACIEGQNDTDSVLASLREKEQRRPTLPHLVPASRAPLGVDCSRGKRIHSAKSARTLDSLLPGTFAHARSGMGRCELHEHRRENFSDQ